VAKSIAKSRYFINTSKNLLGTIYKRGKICQAEKQQCGKKMKLRIKEVVLIKER
jgi:hypothetical protein